MEGMVLAAYDEPITLFPAVPGAWPDAAFADFRAMHAMSDEKFADYWRTFKACVDAYEAEAENLTSDDIVTALLDNIEVP